MSNSWRGAAVAGLLVVFACGAAWAATHEVGPGDDWATVIAGAAAGDTIQVREGAPAPVNVEIDKQLTIENYPGESPVLDGTGTAYHGFRIRTGGDGSAISSLTFQNYTNRAITEHYATVSVSISDCVFDNCNWTLGLQVTADGCEFKNANRAGYNIRSSSFTGCTFSNLSAYAVYNFDAVSFTNCSFQSVYKVAASGSSVTLDTCTVDGANHVTQGIGTVTALNCTLSNISYMGYASATTVTIGGGSATDVKYLVYSADGGTISNLTVSSQPDVGHYVLGYCDNVTAENVTTNGLKDFASSCNNITLTDCTINDCTTYGVAGCGNVTMSGTTLDGGYMAFCNTSGLDMTRCLILNHQTGVGEGFYHSYGVLTNCTIYGNERVLAWQNEGTTDFDSCIVYGNADFYEGTIQAGSTAVYSILPAEAADVLTLGDGNLLEADPMFMDALGGDFGLKFASPAINSGNPNLPVPPQGGDRVDMGAIEYTVQLHGPLYTVGLDAGQEFTTPQAAVDALIANAGLNGGDLPQDSTILLQPGTYVAEPGNVVIDLNFSLFNSNGKSITILAAGPGMLLSVPSTGYGVRVSGSFDSQLVIDGINGQGNSGTFLTIEGNTTFVDGSMTIRNSLYKDLDFGIIAGPQVHGNVVVDGCEFDNCFAGGIRDSNIAYPLGTGLVWNITSSVFRNCGYAVQLWGGTPGDNYFTKCRVTQCTSQDAAVQIFNLRNAQWLITDNEITRSAGKGLNGQMMFQAVVVGNTARDNAGMGLYCRDIDAGYMIDNRTGGNGDYGIYANFSIPGEIAYNTCLGDSKGIGGSVYAGVMHHNVVYALDGPALAVAGESTISVFSNTLVSEFGDGIEILGWQADLKHNIVVVKDPAAFCIYVWGGQTTLNSDYNDLYPSNGGGIAHVVDELNQIDETYVQLDGPDGWQAAGYDANSISADPYFADALSHDYHLKSTAGRYDPGTSYSNDLSTWVQDAVHSPCIDAGDPDPNPDYDPIFGYDRNDFSDEPWGGTAINLGAYGNTQQASCSTPGDSTPPAITYAPVGSTGLLEFTVTDDHDAAPTHRLYLDGFEAMAESNPNPQHDWLYQPGFVSAGDHEYRIVARDNWGNESEETVGFSVPHVLVVSIEEPGDTAMWPLTTGLPLKTRYTYGTLGGADIADASVRILDDAGQPIWSRLNLETDTDHWSTVQEGRTWKYEDAIPASVLFPGGDPGTLPRTLTVHAWVGNDVENPVAETTKDFILREFPGGGPGGGSGDNPPTLTITNIADDNSQTLPQDTDGWFYSDKTEITISFSTNGDQVYLEGASASVDMGQGRITAWPSEGDADLVVTATSAGGSTYVPLKIRRDTAPPTVVVSDPQKITTLNLGFLLMTSGPDDDAQQRGVCDVAHQFVFDVSDGVRLNEGAQCVLKRYAWDALAYDCIFPFVKYAERSPFKEFEEDKLEVTETASASADPQGDPDKDWDLTRVLPIPLSDTEDRVYAVVVEVKDFAGNIGKSAPIFIRCDFEAPKLCGGKSEDADTWNNYLNDKDIQLTKVDEALGLGGATPLAPGLNTLSHVAHDGYWLLYEPAFVKRCVDKGCGIYSFRVRRSDKTGDDDWQECRRASPGSSYWVVDQQGSVPMDEETVAAGGLSYEYELVDLVGNKSNGQEFFTVFPPRGTGPFALESDAVHEGPRDGDQGDFGNDSLSTKSGQFYGYAGFSEEYESIKITHVYYDENGEETGRQVEGPTESGGKKPYAVFDVNWWIGQYPFLKSFTYDWDIIHHDPTQGTWHEKERAETEYSSGGTKTVTPVEEDGYGASVSTFTDENNNTLYQVVMAVAPGFDISTPIGVQAVGANKQNNISLGQVINLGYWQLFVSVDDHKVECTVDLGKASPESGYEDQASADTVDSNLTLLSSDHSEWKTDEADKFTVPAGDSRAGLRAITVRETDIDWDLLNIPDAPEWLTEMGCRPIKQMLPARVPVIDVYPDVLLAGQTQKVYIRGWFVDDWDGQEEVTFTADNFKFGDGTKITVLSEDEDGNDISPRLISDDPLNRLNVQAIECWVEVSDDVSLDYHDSEITDPNDELDTIDDTYMIEDAVRAIGLDVVRETSPGSEEYEAVEAMMISYPYPVIRLDDISESDISIQEDGTTTVTVSGEVYDGMADVVANGDADIKYVLINGIEIQVTRDAAYENANKSTMHPYAFRGSFQQEIATHIIDGGNALYAETSPNALGHVGFDMITFEVETNAEELLTQGTPWSLDLAMKIDALPAPDNVDQIWLRTCPSFDFNELSEAAGAPESSIFGGVIDGIGPTTVELTHLSGLGVNEADTAAILLTNEELNMTHGYFTLQETGADTGVFVPLRTLVFRFTDDPGNVDVVTVGYIDPVGVFVFFDLEEVAPLTFSGTAGILDDVEVVFPNFAFSPDSRETVTCTFSSTGLQVSDVPLTVVENSATSKDLRTPELEDESLLPLNGGSMPIQQFTEINVVAGSIKNHDETFAGRTVPYLIEVHDPQGSSDKTSYDDEEFDLLPAEGLPDVKRTTVPIVVVDQATYRTPATATTPPVAASFAGVHVVESGTLGKIHYNPDGWIPRLIDGKKRVIYAGPYYLYQNHVSFQQGKDELISYTLAKDVNSVRIVIFPDGRPETEAVVDISHTNDAFTKKGTHRLWDGRTNTGNDADGNPNNVGGQFKYIDPNKYVATDKRSFQVYQYKRYVDGVEDTSAAFTFEVRSKEIWLCSPATDLVAENYVYGVLGALDAKTGDYMPTTVLPAVTDSPVIGLKMSDKSKFREAYQMMTVRGRLISIGHGGIAITTGGPDVYGLVVLGRGGPFDPNHSIFLPNGEYDPEQVYAGFRLEGSGGTGTGVQNASVYDLPRNDLHGVYIELRHCWSANDGPTPNLSVAKTLSDVLNHPTSGIGNGQVVGFYGLYNQATGYPTWEVRLGPAGPVNTRGQQPGNGGATGGRVMRWMREREDEWLAVPGHRKYEYARDELTSVAFGDDLAANINGVPQGTRVLSMGLYFFNQRFFVGKLYDPTHLTGVWFKSPGTTDEIVEDYRGPLGLRGIAVDGIVTELGLYGPGRVGAVP